MHPDLEDVTPSINPGQPGCEKVVDSLSLELDTIRLVVDRFKMLEPDQRVRVWRFVEAYMQERT